MSRDEIFESYAENAFDLVTKENSIVWKKEWYDANFKKFFPEKRTARILDIGPGLGELLLTERDWGYTNCFAVDISPSVVQYCKKRGLNCDKTDNTSAWLREHRESFELITVLDVFEHIPQEMSIDFLKACKDALSKNGILILQVPNIQSAESYLHRYNDITHVFGYSQHTLEQLISIVGFETVGFYPFEEYPGNDLDSKMIRRLRSIYWKSLRMNRKITHNLDPEILTPELFVVMANEKCELPDHVLEEEFEDGKVTLKDIGMYFESMGINSEAFEQICKINDLERLISTQNRNSIEKLDEYNEMLQVLKNDMKQYDRRLKEQGCNYEEHLDEQNGRLVQFVDHHVERLNQYNLWTRERLDYLEMKVEKMDRLLMNIRYPFRTLFKKIKK